MAKARLCLTRPTARLAHRISMPTLGQKQIRPSNRYSWWIRRSTTDGEIFRGEAHLGMCANGCGNVREWLHTSWLYDSRADRYRAGLQRFAEFGIELDPYIELSVSHLEGYRKLNADIGKRFYDLDEEWFLSMQQRYSVSYVVMRKDGLVRNYSFGKVFENQHFVIFDLR